MPTTVYNATVLAKWQNEATLLNEQITEHTQAIESNKAALQPLRSRLATIHSELSSLQHSLLWTEVNQMQARSYRNYHHSPYYKSYYYQPGIHSVCNISDLLYINSLYNRKSELQAEQTRLNAQIAPLQASIDQSQAELQRTQAEISLLNTQLNAGTTFLSTLKTNPEHLVTQLHEAILTAFKTYDDANPTNRSPQVRVCLYAIEEKLKNLSAAKGPATDLNAWRLNYLDLCAVLQNMHAQVEQEGKDPAFHAILTQLLEGTHIAINGDLPDDMQSGSWASSRYTFIMTQDPHHFAVTPELLLILEKQRYIQKIEELEGGIFVYEMQKKIQKVIDAIKAEVNEKKLKQETIDYHFYNRILTDMWQVSNHRNDHATIKHLSVLANAASGSPSTGKKVAGALLVLVGALLFAASIAFLALTMGGSAIASGFGAALGLTLMQSQICLGVTASLTTIAGGGLGFWGGRKVKEGMRQGLSKDIVEFKNDIESRTMSLS